MLLLIDTNKIAEQLKHVQTSYVVTPCDIEIQSVNYAIPTVEVNGMAITMPPELERARARLMSLRQSLIARGIEPLSADDLDRKIDETRGR